MVDSGNPNAELTYRQGIRELSGLRQAVKDDPEAAKEVERLARQMQQLDPSRFPGNPAMVDQMHQEVLNSIDRLELQLGRDEASTDARTGKPYVVPVGYQDSVAEYYRRLSKSPQGHGLRIDDASEVFVRPAIQERSEGIKIGDRSPSSTDP